MTTRRLCALLMCLCLIGACLAFPVSAAGSDELMMPAAEDEAVPGGEEADGTSGSSGYEDEIIPEEALDETDEENDGGEAAGEVAVGEDKAVDSQEGEDGQTDADGLTDDAALSEDDTEPMEDDAESTDDEGSDEMMLRAAPSPYLSGPLPDQGMYAIICAADTSYAIGTSGNATAYGTAIVTQPWDHRPTEAWIIRRAQDNYYYIKAGVNYYDQAQPTPTIGWSSGEELSLMVGWLGNSKPEGELFQLSFDANGACLFTHKSTGKVLDVAGGTPGNGVRLQVHRSNGTAAQRFYLIDLKTHDIAYTVTNRTNTGAIGQNALEIDNLNGLSLPQNQMATAQSLSNVTWGSGVTVTAETGFANKSNWALSADGATLLPAYRAVMNASNPGSAEEFVEVTYPEAGRYFDGRTTIRVGARVRFSNMVPADILSQSFDWVSSTPADGHKYLVIGTNLFSGFWYNNIIKMDVSVSFFNAVTGEPVSPRNAYLTFNSLSNNIHPENLVIGRDIAIPSTDAYGEYVGIKDQAVTGYVSGPLGNSASPDSEAVTNIVSMDLEIWPPYADSGLNGGVQSVFIGQSRRYPGSTEFKQASWTDALGETNFTRNSVSLPLDNAAATTFVLGTLKGEAWNSFSSVPIYANVEAPAKRVAEATGEGAEYDSKAASIPLASGEVTFRVVQKVPQVGIDTAEALEYLTVSDVINGKLQIVDVQVEAPGSQQGTQAAAQAYGASSAALTDQWIITRNGQTVTFNYTGDYREILDDGSGTTADGGKVIAGSFLIKVRPSASAASGDVIPNTAVTRWKMTAGSPGNKPSNQVTVTPFDGHAETEIPILNAGGTGSAGYIGLGGILLGAAGAAAFLRKKRFGMPER